MTVPMIAAPSGLPSVPSAFATEFVHAMIAAKLITPLVPTDGTDFSAPEESPTAITIYRLDDKEHDKLSMLWTGKNAKLLPPRMRFLPRLFRMPGVHDSEEDINAMEQMAAYRKVQPKSVIHLSNRRGVDDWTPSFYQQLEFMYGLVSITVDKLANGSELSINLQEAAQRPDAIVDVREIANLQRRCFDHVQYGQFLKLVFDLTSATILATSQNSEDRIAAANVLSQASLALKDMDLTSLGAIALETSWNLYIGAHGYRPLSSDHDGLLTLANLYLSALKALEDPNQDPLGYSVMLTRGLTISMDKALQSLLSDLPSTEFFELAHEFSCLSYMWHTLKNVHREAAADITRLMWLAGHLKMPEFWSTSEKLIDSVASLLARSGESQINIAKIWSWAEAASKIRKGETS